MRSRFLLSLLSLSCLAIAPTAQAQVVYDNPRNADAIDAGAFSHPTQRLASRFSLAADANVTAASWFGTMNASDPLNTGDLWTFDLEFRSAIGGKPAAVFASRSVNATVLETSFSILGDRVYRFDALFGGVGLTASTDYFFSAINTGPAATFRWNQGTVADGAMFSNGNASAWNAMESTRAPLAYRLSASPTTIVPEPSSMLLLASALPVLLFVAGQRRKSTR